MVPIRPLNRNTATLLAVLVATLALAFDLSQPLGVSAGIPYVILPLLGLLSRSSVLIIGAAAAGTMLVYLGMLLSPPNVDLSIVLLNRGMSSMLVWVTALVALRHLHVGNCLQQQLKDLAATDPLTGICNRRHFFEALHTELKRYERYGDPFSLILIDADHFKQINDRYGHAIGDATLCWIADSCRQCVREPDLVGRFGGEEFVILLPQTTADEAVVVAERIRRVMHDHGLRRRGNAAEVTLSFGVAEAGPATATFDDILKAADDALFHAKRGGRDRVARHGAGLPESFTIEAA